MSISVFCVIGMFTFKCAIEQIASWHPQLFLDSHVVACVAMMNLHSSSPAVFEVECENITSDWLGEETTFRLEVSWFAETESKAARLRSTVQKRPIIEMAASALAFSLTPHVIDLGELSVANYGERADYLLLDRAGVLEISGTELPGELARRHREKVTQALENPYSLDAYVVVCSFAAAGNRIRFSYHRWKE